MHLKKGPVPLASQRAGVHSQGKGLSLGPLGSPQPGPSHSPTASYRQTNLPVLLSPGCLSSSLRSFFTNPSLVPPSHRCLPHAFSPVQPPPLLRVSILLRPCSAIPVNSFSVTCSISHQPQNRDHPFRVSMTNNYSTSEAIESQYDHTFGLPLSPVFCPNEPPSLSLCFFPAPTHLLLPLSLPRMDLSTHGFRSHCLNEHPSRLIPPDAIQLSLPPNSQVLHGPR